MEDRISGGLQHCHETCCEKGDHHGRRACMVQRWFHHGDVVSGLVYDIKAVLSLLMEWMRFSMKQASSSLFLDKDHFLV